MLEMLSTLNTIRPRPLATPAALLRHECAEGPPARVSGASSRCPWGHLSNLEWESRYLDVLVRSTAPDGKDKKDVACCGQAYPRGTDNSTGYYPESSRCSSLALLS